jgi:hypothetical protein
MAAAVQARLVEERRRARRAALDALEARVMARYNGRCRVVAWREGGEGGGSEAFGEAGCPICFAPCAA